MSGGGREKVQLFLTEEFQLISVEGIREIENHHCTNMTVIIFADNIHRSMLRLVSKCVRRNRIFA